MKSGHKLMHKGLLTMAILSYLRSMQKRRSYLIAVSRLPINFISSSAPPHTPALFPDLTFHSHLCTCERLCARLTDEVQLRRVLLRDMVKPLAIACILHVINDTTEESENVQMRAYSSMVVSGTFLYSTQGQ